MGSQESRRPSEYVVLQQNPSPQDYHDLRKNAGLTPPPFESITTSLAGTWVSFVAFERKEMLDGKTPKNGQRAVAMGRLVGDGALFFCLVDVAVDPAHQRKGLGNEIMEKLVAHSDAHAPHAYVSLVAEPMGQRLYPRYGFEDVKPSIGMYRCPRIQGDPEFQKVRKEKAAALFRPSSG